MIKQHLTPLVALTLANAFALDHMQSPQVSGNPIERQDSYTINSTRAKEVVLHCKFTNTAKKPAKLAIWTSPTQTEPDATFLLEANKTVTKTWQLQLEKDWWCVIYLPETKRDWRYCHYFSVSDQTISNYHPFANWNSTTRSKDTFYNCSIDDEQSAFFYFK